MFEEEMAFRSRSKRMEKLKKRREVAKAFKEKEAAERDKELEQEIEAEAEIASAKNGSVDTGPRARQRRLSQEFKRINSVVKSKPAQERAAAAFDMISHLKDDDDDSTMTDTSHPFNLDPLSITSGIPFEGEGGGEARSKSPTELIRANTTETIDTDRSDESKRPVLPDLKSIDMLEWDRQERDEEMDLMQEMIKYGKETVSETRKRVRQVARESAKQSTMNVSRKITCRHCR
jgi:hypothetical protein